MGKVKSGIAAVILGGCIFALAGCGSQAGGPSSAEIDHYNKQHNIVPSKVNSFLDQLQKVPFAQRRDFMNAHPDDMRTLGEDQDPAVQARYQKIIRGES